MSAKILKTFLFLCLFAMAFLCAETVDTFDEVAVFQEADDYYIAGKNPEMALSLYKSILEKGQDSNLKMLSSMKIGVIYEEQLLQLENAILAYESFLNQFPNSRLLKVVNTSFSFLKSLQNAGVLAEFQALKLLSREYQSAITNPAIPKHMRMQIAKKLYDLAKENRNKVYSKEAFSFAMSSLVRERMYLEAHELLEIIDAELPQLKSVSDIYSDVVEIQSKRVHIYHSACAFLVLCLAFIIFRRGYRGLGKTINDHKKFILTFAMLIGAYMVLSYEIILRADQENEFTYMDMAFIAVQYVLLIPFSLACNAALKDIGNLFLRVGLQSIMVVLIGLSSWIIYAHKFDYLWLLSL